MHVGHQRRQIAMRRDQVVAHAAQHIAWMAGHVAQARDAGHASQTAQQLTESDRRAAGVETVIGVDVLADQGDFAHA